MGLWPATVTKREHGFISDVADIPACEAHRLNEGWLADYIKVMTSGGGMKEHK